MNAQSVEKPILILQAPDRRLKEKSKVILAGSEEARVIVRQLKIALTHLDRPWRWWIALAAPQLGFNKRVIAIKRGRGRFEVIINPEVIRRKWTIPFPARCFSLKGTFIVPRPMFVLLRYHDERGKLQAKLFFGPRAALLQQEIDHLDGRLLTDFSSHYSTPNH